MINPTSFQQRLNSRFEGLLRWQQLDEFWPILKQSEYSWYFYQVGSALPEKPLTPQELLSSIDELDVLLHKEHDYDYCGLVYVDSPSLPTLVKVYDPNNLGSSCGCGGEKIPPRWIISQQKPEKIIDDAPMPNNRKRWWNQLFRLR